MIKIKIVNAFITFKPANLPHPSPLGIPPGYLSVLSQKHLSQYCDLACHKIDEERNFKVHGSGTFI